MLYIIVSAHLGFPGGSAVKNPPASAGDSGDVGSIPGLGRSREKEVATHSCLGNPHGQKSLEGYSPWGFKKLDTT